MRPRCSRGRFIFSLLILTALLMAGASVPKADIRAADPGPRGGPPGAGGPLPGIEGPALELFLAGQEVIQEVDSVKGTVSNTGLGLGPRFNMDSCGGCHNYPAPGGSSPRINPQVAVATKEGATNKVPSFVAIDGPIRRAFVRRNQGENPAGSQPISYDYGARRRAGCVSRSQT